MVQCLVDARDASRNELDQLKSDLQSYLEEQKHEMAGVKHEINGAVQREATLLARMELLVGQVSSLNESVRRLQFIHRKRRGARCS